jgi:hypothetical protein
MDRRLDWIVRHGALATALYFGIVADIGWLQGAVIAFVWWTLAMTVWGKSGDAAPGAAKVPPAAAMIFDFAVLAAMFVGHWYWTAFAHAASCGCRALVRARATSKP